ncbi:helix-turn-helix transcriptional regulator [Haloarcula litorea]|uniref:helix-turn-helix transcriptional regulator n=1 Tax=Haloarcula litorea TaxID=3032579 RepID=UPI0023E8931B|nr:ArsR family transcriptional regulator [Halomicroarcula sp. GDY20]
MDDTLAEVEFLALSANRVAVLELLAAGHHTRSELAAETGASQATLGRILGDFEDREWVRRADGGYVATATGELVADGFRNLLDVLATERELRGVVEFLPAEAMDFDLRHLADATITRPTQTRPNAPLQRLLELVGDADEVVAFSHALNDQILAAATERIDERRFDVVLSRPAVEALLADETLGRQLRTLARAEAASVRVADGEIPLAVTVADDDVILLVRDDRGVLRAAVDTAHPDVLAWARDRYEEYRAASTPLAESGLLDGE